MNTLYLTADEKKLFDALPAAVRDGWVIELEQRTFVDTPEKRNMRFSLVRLHDPKLLAFRDRIASMSSADALISVMKDMDMQGVSEDDLAELFFALGPNVLSVIIPALITAATTDASLEEVCSLSVLRRSLLSSFSN